MFFLLKSTFWLGLVFYCMSWPGGEQPANLARQAAGEAAQRAQASVVETAVSACKADPARCFAMASHAAGQPASAGREPLRGTMSD